MKRSLFPILLGLFVHRATGQSFNRTMSAFLVGYEVAMPSGFIDKMSWVGGRIEHRSMLNPQLSLGLGISWNNVHQYLPRKTYQKYDQLGAVTADVIQELYSVPFTVSGHYYLRRSQKLIPYAGANIGVQYSDSKLTTNVFYVDDVTWGFVARPEAGLIVPAAFGGIFASASYNFATNHSSSLHFNKLHSFTFTVGFLFGAPSGSIAR